MAIATTAHRENAALGYSQTATHVSVHTADPGTTGANEVTGGGYARAAITWTAGAVDGVVTGKATVTVANGVAITHVGVWTAVTGGTFLDKAAAAVTSTGSVVVSLTYTQTPADTTPPPVEPEFTRTVDDVVYAQYGAPLRTDGTNVLWGKHEQQLGITATNYDWYHGARPGITPPYPNTTDGLVYTAHNVWGQVIPVLGGMPAAHRDVRVQLSAPEVWHLEGGVWINKTPADLKSLDGGYWNGGGTYTKIIDWPSSEPNAYWRREPAANGGGYSFDCKPMTNADGSVKVDTSIAHFFWNGFMPRIAIAAGAQVAIVSRFRLITDNPNVDVGQAKFVGAFSGDAFETTTTTIGSNGRNPPLAITRHITLTDEWRHVGHVTGSEAQIRGYPTMPFLV